MNKKLWIVMCCVLLSFNAFAETLSVSWESWEPYQYEDSSRTLSGIDIEIATAVLTKAGITPEFKERPWKRTLEEVKTGALHIALGASKSAEREEYAFFSDSYRTESVNLFIRKGEAKNYKIKTLEDIKTYKFNLGVTRGYWYGDNYEALSKDPEFLKYAFDVTSDEINFKKLLGNRIDGFLADQYAGPFGLKKENSLQYVEILPVPIYTDSIFFMFSKATVDPTVVTRVNAALASLQKDGTIKKIQDKYLK